MNKPIFRASFTYLNLWESGRWQDAIKAYFKLDKFITRQMAEGLEFHQEWEEHIKKTGCLPDVFGGKKLNNPICEDKLELPLYDWCTVVIKPDCIEAPILHEFKTGVQSSADYANSFQAPVYAVGLTLNKTLINQIHIHHYNQYNKKSDFSMVWVTDKVIKDGLNYIETVGGEMHRYFVDNGLYERFGAGAPPLEVE